MLFIEHFQLGDVGNKANMYLVCTLSEFKHFSDDSGNKPCGEAIQLSESRGWP